MQHDVFVSYASDDKAVADAVVATLEAKRIRCWIAPRDVLPGVPYAKALTDAIDASRILVLVFSSGSNVSPQVMREVERGVHNDIPIIPFRIENIVPTEAMAYLVEGLHWLDAMSPPLEKHLDRLSETVRILLTQETLPASTPPPTVSPAPPPSTSPKRIKRPWLIAAAALLAGALLGAVALFSQHKSPSLSVDTCEHEPKRLVVAGKRFLESSILVELIAIALESENPNIKVERQHYRADSPTLFEDLTFGEIHIYPEYSGTLLIDHLRQPNKIAKNDKMHATDKMNSLLHHHPTGRDVVFSEPFGFDNPFVVVMRRDKAHEIGLVSQDGVATISKLTRRSRSLKFASTSGFLEREDGRQFLKKYGLQFQGEIESIEHDNKYRALKAAEIDVTDGYATDPQLLDPEFIYLIDDQELFTSYKAAPLVRKDVLCPGVKGALEKLAGKVKKDDMVRLISRAIYERLDTANLATAQIVADEDEKEHQRNLRKLRYLVYQFAQAKEIVTPQLPDVVLLKPADGDEILGLPIIYRWKFAGEEMPDPLFEMERREGEKGPFRPPEILRDAAYSDLFYTGIMSWRVRAIDPDRHAVGRWSEWRTVQRDVSRWSRIERTGKIRVGIGKRDDLFIRDEGDSIGGAEIELLRGLLEHRLRKELGARPLTLYWDKFEWGDDMFLALKKNKNIDLLVSRISITDDRRKKYDLAFTKPTISYPQSVIANVGRHIFENARIALSRLGAQSDTTNEELARRLLDESYGQYVVKRQRKNESCDASPCLLLWSGPKTDYDEVEALKKGIIDGIVVDKAYAYHLKNIAGFEVQIEDITGDQVVGIAGLEDERIGFAVRKDDTELLDNLNRAIDENSQLLEKFEKQVLPAR